MKSNHSNYVLYFLYFITGISLSCIIWGLTQNLGLSLWNWIKSLFFSNENYIHDTFMYVNSLKWKKSIIFSLYTINVGELLLMIVSYTLMKKVTNDENVINSGGSVNLESDPEV